MVKDFPVKVWVTVALIAILIMSVAIFFENQSENNYVQTEVIKQTDDTQIDNTSSKESAEEIEITKYTLTNYGGEIYTPEPMDFGANLVNGTIVKDASVYNNTAKKHVLFQFYDNTTMEQMKLLEEYGIQYVGGAAKYTLIVSMPAYLTTDDLPAESGLRWIGEIPIQNKYDSNLGLDVPKWAFTEDGKVKIEIQFYEDITSAEAQNVLNKYSSTQPELIPFTSVVYEVITEEQNLSLIANEDIVKMIVFPSPGEEPD